MEISSNQLLFNAAYLGLKSQDFERCIDPESDEDDPSCLYNGPNDTHCAIGYCIDVPKMFEGVGVSRSPQLQALLEEKYPGIDMYLVYDLQDVHDTCSDPDELAAEMEEIADKYGLDIPS